VIDLWTITGGKVMGKKMRKVALRAGEKWRQNAGNKQK
jgi:hypothetical protein